jgi:hypothetical protein
LPTAGDEDIGAFLDKELSGGETDSAAAAGNDRDFSSELRHVFDPSRSV